MRHPPTRLLLRLRSLAKFDTADVWVVLDDEQFCRRDHQHRARLGQLDDPRQQQWLSLNIHLPNGRATLINEAWIVDRELCRRRIEGMTAQYFARSPHWQTIREPVQEVVRLIDKTEYLDEKAEASTRMLLELLGWHGETVHSSDFAVRSGRSERLADLTRVVGATGYLCGTGGARYLDEQVFRDLDLRVQYTEQPPWITDALWQQGRNISALWAMTAQAEQEGQ